MILAVLTLLTALAISAVAAYYSIIGLIAIFSAVVCTVRTSFKKLCKHWQLQQLLYHHYQYDNQYLSRIHAVARPPSAQAVNNAYFLSSLCSLLDAVVINLTPVAPKGCPMERDPP